MLCVVNVVIVMAIGVDIGANNMQNDKKIKNSPKT